MKKLLIAVFLSFITPIRVSGQPVIESADGVAVKVNSTAKLITIGGSITETVFALGFGDQVVATDLSSTYPSRVFALPRVPYVRNLTSEGILSLSPTLVLSSDDANPRSAIKQMRDAGTSVLLVREETSLEGVVSKIETVGKALNAQDKAKNIISENERLFNLADSLRIQFGTKPKVMFVLAVRGENTFMVAGEKTGAQIMIELAGGVNAFNDFEGYKTATNESILAANPDYILVMETRLDDIKNGLEKTPGVNVIQAVKNNRVIAMDGNYLLGFGPRFGAAIIDLMRQLHPDISIES